MRGRVTILVAMSLLTLGSQETQAQSAGHDASADRHSAPQLSRVSSDELGRWSFTVAFGTTKPYLDEPWQPAGGVSFRYRMADKWSIEPEVLVSVGRRFRQWRVIPKVVYDVTRIGQAAVLYGTGGLGYARELDKAIRYYRAAPIVDAGIGLRVRAGRFVVSPEVRLLRVSLGIGYMF